MSSRWLRAVPHALVAWRVSLLSVFVALAALTSISGCGVVTSAPSISAPLADGSFGAAASSSGGSVTDDASSSCHASEVLTYMQGSYLPAEAPSGACLDADGGGIWDGFYEACLGPMRDSAACDSYKATPGNAACADCVLTPYTAEQLGPILDFGEFVGGNVAGCIELTTPGDPSCPRAVQALSDCEIAACEANCPVDDATSLAARQQCAIEADQSGCSSFSVKASACRAAEMDAGLAGPCTNAGFKDFYDNVVPLFCGQEWADAAVAGDAAVSDGSADASLDGGAPAAPSDAGAD